MSVRLRWTLILGFSCLFLAALLQVPQMIHLMHPLSEGVLMDFTSDEYYYLPRVMEALSGRPEQAAEAYTGDHTVVALQGALIERFYGFLFRWTGWTAITVMQILDSIIPPLLFLAMWWFLRLSGFTRWQAFGGSVLFVILELYSLNRPIHQRSSFLLVLLSFLAIKGGLKRWYSGVIGGALLGLLVGVYFWSWTYAWAWWGVILLWEFGEWFHKRKGKQWQWLLLFGAVGALVALPFITHLVTASQHPLFEVTQFRTGLYHSRAPESWIRSVLFLGMVIGVLGACVTRYKIMRPYRDAIAIVFVGFIVLNQQAVHGVILFFASHYLFPLVFSGVTCLLLSLAVCFSMYSRFSCCPYSFSLSQYHALQEG